MIESPMIKIVSAAFSNFRLRSRSRDRSDAYANMHANRNSNASSANASSPSVLKDLSSDIALKIPITVRHAPTIAADTLKICMPICLSSFSLIWSLTAFADAERLRPTAAYQLRPGSIGRALGAGFDLDQIETYLERQSCGPIPDALKTLLRQWTISYRRVRLRRATVLHADTPEAMDDLKRIAMENGMQLLGEPTADGGLVVLLPALGEDGVSAEDHLLKALRAGGYVGQWATTLRNEERGKRKEMEP